MVIEKTTLTSTAAREDMGEHGEGKHRPVIGAGTSDQKVPRHVTAGPVTGCHSPVLNNYPGHLQAQAAAENKQGPFDARTFCKTLESRNIYGSKDSETEVPPN